MTATPLRANRPATSPNSRAMWRDVGAVVREERDHDRRCPLHQLGEGPRAGRRPSGRVKSGATVPIGSIVEFTATTDPNPTMTPMPDDDAEWVVVAEAAPGPGEVRADDDHDVVVWTTFDGTTCVMDGRCPHEWSHLGAEGVVDGDELVCAAHFWRFATDGTGTKLNVKGRRDAKGDIEVFPSRVEDGRVLAKVRNAHAARARGRRGRVRGRARRAGRGAVERVRADHELRQRDDREPPRLARRHRAHHLRLRPDRRITGSSATSRTGRRTPARSPTRVPPTTASRRSPTSRCRATRRPICRTKEQDGNFVMQIGDPNQTVTGVHTYVISYRIRRRVQRLRRSRRARLQRHGQRMGRADRQGGGRRGVRRSPRRRRRASPGELDSQLPCDLPHDRRRHGASFTQSDLAAGEGLTVVVAYPRNTVDATPILEEVPTIGSAFRPTGPVGRPRVGSCCWSVAPGWACCCGGTVATDGSRAARSTPRSPPRGPDERVPLTDAARRSRRVRAP